MQANDVNQALKRVSSDEIKRNYTQITGREALERLLAGEVVYDGDGVVRKIFNNKSQVSFSSGEWHISTVTLNCFLDPAVTDWYVEPPFDARKEMLARPGEWVAKYEKFGNWRYIGFDLAEMAAVYSEDIYDVVGLDISGGMPASSSINEAIPLDDADLAKLAALKANEKGVEA